MRTSEAFWEGYRAYQNGVKRKDNPYYNEDEGADWDLGWREAACDE